MFGKKKPEVLIAGAGPVGLFAAVILAKQGVLEKAEVPTRMSVEDEHSELLIGYSFASSTESTTLTHKSSDSHSVPQSSSLAASAWWQIDLVSGQPIMVTPLFSNSSASEGK